MNIISIAITVIIIITITASCSFLHAQRQTSHYLLINRTTCPRYKGKQIFARLISERTRGLPYKWNITFRILLNISTFTKQKHIIRCALLQTVVLPAQFLFYTKHFSCSCNVTAQQVKNISGTNVSKG